MTLNQQLQLLDMPIKKKMNHNSFRQINEDIRKLVNKAPTPPTKRKKVKPMPLFERVNDDVPYLTEAKLVTFACTER